MKLAMRVTLGCLLLIFALLFGGCGLIPNPFSQEPSGETAGKKAELEKQENNKQDEIEKFNEKLKKQEQNATDERKLCNQYSEKTKNDGKDPEDPKLSPVTFVQCNDAGAAEIEVNETRKKIETAKSQLADIQNQKSQLISDKPVDNNYGWLMSLLIGVAGVLGLAILLGGLYILLSKKIDKAIATERGLNQQSFDRIKAKHDKFKELFAEHGKVMNDLERLVKLQQGKIEVLEFKSKEGGGNLGGQPPSQPIFEQPQYIKPEPQFPVSAENYLNKVGNQAEMATPDKFSEGLLIQDPGKDQEFLIVKDSARADGLYYAVPKFTRFATKSEYNLYYRTYYDCENPAGGTIWIVSPTIVRRVSDGWKLEQKGKLEVR